MKVTVSLPDALFEQAEQLVEQRRTSRSQVYAQALEEYLAHHAPEAITEAINKLVDEQGGELDPFVREATRRRLKAVEW